MLEGDNACIFSSATPDLAVETANALHAHVLSGIFARTCSSPTLVCRGTHNCTHLQVHRRYNPHACLQHISSEPVTVVLLLFCTASAQTAIDHICECVHLQTLFVFLFSIGIHVTVRNLLCAVCCRANKQCLTQTAPTRIRLFSESLCHTWTCAWSTCMTC